MTYNANIHIKDNIIDQGRFSDSSSPVTYNYAHSAWVYGSAFIENNVFSNPAASADMLKIPEGSCIIRNNKFIRNSTSINSYITCSEFGTNEITDNIFDSTTVNGSSEKLVVGLKPGSIYTRNRNQTGYVYIPLFEPYWSLDDPQSSGDKTLIIESSGDSQNSFVVKRHGGNNLITSFEFPFEAGTPEHFVASKSFNVGSYLEKGMEITSLRIGAFIDEGDITDFSPVPYFSLVLRSHLPSESMDAAAYATATEESEQTFNYDISSSGQVAALKAATQYTGSSSGGGSSPAGDYNGFVYPDLWRAGNGYNMEIEFMANMTFVLDDWEIKFTPIEIKYKW